MKLMHLNPVISHSYDNIPSKEPLCCMYIQDNNIQIIETSSLIKNKPKNL